MPKTRVVVGKRVQAHGGDKTGANVQQIPLGIHVQVVGDGEPEMFPTTAQPIFQDQSRDGPAFAHAGWENVRSRATAKVGADTGKGEHDEGGVGHNSHGT